MRIDRFLPKEPLPVSVDLRAALAGALDVDPPRTSFERILSRSVRQAREARRRSARSMLAAATLVVAVALFAGAYTGVDVQSVHVASAPAPAPVPLST